MLIAADHATTGRCAAATRAQQDAEAAGERDDHEDQVQEEYEAGGVRAGHWASAQSVRRARARASGPPLRNWRMTSVRRPLKREVRPEMLSAVKADPPPSGRIARPIALTPSITSCR
jgi:hypothetical protein